MSEETKLASLQRQRGQLKRKITDFSSFLDTLKVKSELTVVDFKQLESRIERFSPILDSFEEIQNKIFELQNLDVHDDYASEFESSYFSVIAEAKALFDMSIPNNTNHAGSLSANSESNGTGSGANPKITNVRLPTIALPRYSGNWAQWLEFKDTFASLIHNNQELNDIQRFHYLRSSLQGDAADIIKSLQLTSSNYNIAWDLLCDRYTNKKLLIQNHLSELFQIKPLNRESACHLRELSDSITKHLRALEALNQPVEHWDAIIIYLIASKLDKQSARDWETYKLSGELPTLEELKAFLNSKADMLDNLNRSHSSNLNDSKHNKPEVKNKLSKSFVTRNISCYLCKGAHGLYNCEQFLKMSIKDRLENVNKLKLCNNCLRNSHSAENCNSRSNGCKKCKQNHNTLLHVDDAVMSQPKMADEQVSLSSYQRSVPNQVLLATAIIQVRDKYGKWQQCRALLDSASQSSFITTELHSKLDIQRDKVDIAIQGISHEVMTVTSQSIVNAKSNVKAFNFQLKCLIVDKISGHLPTVSISSKHFNLPENLELADPSFGTPNKIDILIGAQLFWSLITPGHVVLGKNLPIMQNTHLGWILSGPTNVANSNAARTYFTKTLDVQEQLQKFWELEECPNIRPLSFDEQQCEAHFMNSYHRDETGRYVVSIPFKESYHKLGESRSIAEKRLYSVEKKLKYNPGLRQSYKTFMMEYLSMNHMTKLSKPDDTIPHFYMPHHGVTKNDSITTQLRVVFDGSCPTSTKVSLNEIQFVGPTIQSDLFSILIRFRQHTVAVSADIQKMYRQILVNPRDRQFQRVLWREDPSLPVDTFELNTVTYGTASAPFLATRCLTQIANENMTKFPEACQVILSDFYVDDLLSGGTSPPQVALLSSQIATLLKEAHFKLHKWVSNDPQVFSLFEVPDSGPHTIALGLQNTSKTLGLHWSPMGDTLNYKIVPKPPVNTVTKRYILSLISQVFDPLGLLSPCIIIGKAIMQSLWQLMLDWDSPVPNSILEKWNQFQNDLPYLNQIIIPRHILCQDPSRIELHGFSDASAIAYCACVYARSFHTDGSISSHLICAKTKVAPLKSVTIPRLELCAAHLLSKLITVVKESLHLHVDHMYLWSDSTIVLSWIKLPPNQLKVFVSHRVAEIQDKNQNATWLHVPTKDNPADLGSRGLSPMSLQKCELWWKGPTWLLLDNSDWPTQGAIDIPELPEIRRTETALAVITTPGIFEFSRFSSYTKLIRSTAYCLRFIHNCRNTTEPVSGPLTVDECNNAFTHIIKAVQQETFSQEILLLKSHKNISSKSRIRSLAPFIDEDGILRVGGRLEASDLTYDQKHPILLPNHHFTKLLFIHEHRRLLHAGPNLLLVSVRERYWPVNGRNMSKSVVHNCIPCFKAKPRNNNPQMGNLPHDRVTQAMPFQIVGIDYAGPLKIKDRQGRGCKIHKCYIAVFVCLITKALHLELVSSLSTEAFLASLRRFIARRGQPTKIFSDNGSNFTGAYHELRQVVNMLKNDEQKINDELVPKGTSWSFIPPNSPHFGGLWEAGVKSLKFHLKRVAANALLTYEQLYTLLTQIESVLNSRPLFPMSADPCDLQPITPAHFLIGRKLTALPETNLLHLPTNRLSVFQRIQQLWQHFWSRWRSEYLHTLQQRRKWSTSSPNVKVGTMVLLKLDDSPTLHWPIGRITDVFPGKDNIVRVVNIKTTKGTYRRPITKVFPLPQNIECSEPQ